ncbi:MAG: hypothetical protein M4D80_41095 [Myxococcota bacterium]|nr:hypothetical protein [Myxococcota bacterium]
MTNPTTAGIAIALLGLMACGNERNEKTPPTSGQTPTVASPGTPPSAKVRWPKDYCSIVPAEEVTAWLGMTVTTRVQVTTCDYLTNSENGAHISYYSDEGEYRIAKGQREKRGKRGEVVSGLGVEAEYGSHGNGAGLDVVLADGRAFRVDARKPGIGGRDAAAEVAKLVLKTR